MLARQSARVRNEQKQLAAQRAEFDAWQAEKKEIESNPVKWFRKQGLSPDKIANLLLEDQGVPATAKPDEKKPDTELLAIKQELEALKAERQKEREETLAREQNFARSRLVDQIEQRIVADERYEAIKVYADTDVVVDRVAARPAEHVVNLLQAIYAQGATLVHPDGHKETYEPGTDLREERYSRGLDSVVNHVNTKIIEHARRASSIRALQAQPAAAARGNTAAKPALGREGDTPSTKRPPITSSRATPTVLSPQRLTTDADRLSAALAAIVAAQKT